MKKPPPRARLTARQARFVAEYLKDLNGAAAAVRAGYGSKRADQSAYQLLRNSEVASAVAASQAAQLDAAQLTAVRTLEECRRLLLNDIRSFFDDAGNLKPVTDWTAEQGAVVAGVEVIKKNAAAGDGHIDTIYKLKFWNKNQAMDTAFKHLGLLQPDADAALVAVPVFIMPADTDIAIK